MTKITITQTPITQTGTNAIIQFNDGPSHPVTVQDPFSAKQEAELRWYFEEWLAFPFTGHVRAGKAAASVKTYGEALFSQLFQGEVLTEYKMALRFEGGLSDMVFEVRGDPAFHGLHWEALKDPQQKRPFAVECVFIRPNNNPPAIHIRPQPSPTLNILLVSARPGGRQDVGYRTISRPLVESLRQSSLRTHIDIVRPGTYAALVDHLQTSRSQQGDGYYHLIHFDVHGSLLPYAAYQKLDADYSATPFQYKGYGQDKIAPYDGLKAFLAFSGAEPGKPDLVADSEIGGLLQRHQIPIAILNACQSGMQVGESETSLGSRLMAAGVQLALAMGYSVTVSAARLLMEKLYAQLLSGQSVHEAIRRARLELLNQKERRAAYNQRIDLEDWLLPVVYQNRNVTLPLTNFPTFEAEEAFYQKQAGRYQAPTPTYGFFGRDVDILEIETRLLAGGDATGGAATHNLLLVQGMGGAGKTTLLRHLMEWWQTTRLVDHVFYFGYDTKAYTSAQIIDGVARDLYGADYGRAFSPFSDGVKAQKLAEKLRAERHLLVLDNLESITGAALSIQHTLDAGEQSRLRDFLAMLRGGRTLVLLGSRGKEAWLVGAGGVDGHVYELPGLDPEAASGLADGILRRLGKEAYASDPQHQADFQQLMKLLDGYPLALEIVLANLARQTPAELLTAFTAGDDAIDTTTSGDLWQDKTASILRCVEYSHSNLSPDAQALLACLAPFTGVVDVALLDCYTEKLKEQSTLAELPFDKWRDVLQEAVNWGLMTPQRLDDRVFLRLQPIFPYFLRQHLNDPSKKDFQEAVTIAFRIHYNDIGGDLAYFINSKEPKERHLGFFLIDLEYENLMMAIQLSLKKFDNFYNSYEALFRFLIGTNRYEQAIELCQNILEVLESYPETHLTSEKCEDFALVMDRLAYCYVETKKYESSIEIYRHKLEFQNRITHIDTKTRQLKNAGTYHQLGKVAHAQKQWVNAVAYYEKALKIKIIYDDFRGQAGTEHQIGGVAYQQRQWQLAITHYKKALELYKKEEDKLGQARLYHSLGMVYQEIQKWSLASDCYKEALIIFDEYNDIPSKAGTYHQLGTISYKLGMLDEALVHYQRALEIKIEYNDLGAQASTYHQLGIIAEQQKQWTVAEGHFKKTVEILNASDDPYGLADPFYMLGLVAEKQEQWNTSIDYYCQSFSLYLMNDEYWADLTLSRLARVWQAALAQDAAFAAQSQAPARLAEILGVSVAEALGVLQGSS